jgi:nitric oxide reductase NorQ protein
MGRKAKVEVGDEFETVFASNTKKGSRFRFWAKRAGRLEAPKAVFCNDPRVQPGQVCRVRVTRVTKPGSVGRGHIEVELLRAVTLALDDSLWVDPLLKMKLQALLENRMNILLDGPQGSGKTRLAESLARALDMEYVFFNCSPVYEPTDFLCSLQFRKSGDKDFETTWVETPILRALNAAHEEPERRFLVFLDEFNRCREMARNGIMPALDATRKMFNPATGRNLHIPDNVQWVAAINNGAQFTGTTTVDPAQLDRFAPLKIGYPPAAEEVRILCRRFRTVPRRQVERVVTAANAIRTDQQLRLDLSVRATEEACMLLSDPSFAEFDGDAVPELLKDSFCARYAGRWDDPSTDAGLVWQVVVRALEL